LKDRNAIKIGGGLLEKSGIAQAGVQFSRGQSGITEWVLAWRQKTKVSQCIITMGG